MPNCCICLCVYKNEFGLPFVLNNITKLSKLFEKTNILVFYDKSNDRSLKILKQYKNNNTDQHIHIEIIINDQKKSQSRVKNISFARNALIDLIRQKYNHYEYFIMMDSNEYSCIGDINTDNIKDILLRKDWDSISFDREAGYYDTWALSFDPYIYSFFHFSNWQKVVQMMRENFNQLLNDYKINKPDELIPVYSALNGFAIYKTEKFINCYYGCTIDLSLFPLHLIRIEQEITGCKITNNLSNDCEHRHFHLEAIKKNNAKIRISTKSIFAKVKNPPPNSRGPC